MLLLLSACFVLDAKVDTPVDASASETLIFEVPSGSSARSIAPALLESGLIHDDTSWRWYLKSRDAGACLKAGKFELSAAMTYPEIMETLCGVPLADEVPLTLVEGWRIRDLDAALAAEGWIEAGEYVAAAKDPGRFDLPFEVEGLTSLEGFLLPQTYNVPADGFTAEELIQRQVDLFWESWGEGAELGDRDFYDVVIVASMLEREEPKPDNRPLVAGIIWKRLDSGWQLGIDATSRYTLENWNDRKSFLRQLRDPSDPYNTRERKGLPPTPIGNASLPSLQAATQPVASEYWYYLHDGEGNLHPARNAAEHERNRAKYNVY